MDHDLHRLLSAARDDAPPPRLGIDDITAAGRRLARRRRRTVLLSSVAGGLAAVIAGATAAVMLLTPPAIAPAADPDGNLAVAEASPSPARRAEFTQGRPFETTYSGYTSGRYIVGDPDLVTTGYQQSTIDLNPAPTAAASVSASVSAPALARTGPSVSPRGAVSATPPGDLGDPVPREGRLVVYNTGAFDTREFAGGSKVTVGGRTALLRHTGKPSTSAAADKAGCCREPVVPTLAWQYMPGAWAAIYWSSLETAPTRDELIALADALPATDPRPFPTGIRADPVPKGYRLLAAGTRTSPYDETNLSVVRLGLKPLTGPFTAPVDLGQYPSIILTLGVADQLTSDKIGKSACWPGGNVCATLVEDRQFFLQVESVGDRPLTATELSAIVGTLTAEQPDDRTTWPAATSVFTPDP
ncbi:hypothetical protein [Dactylosporangium sp. NPDC005555]|uniref:hypothetical protein n=1 Tax=Dactylosporangium sp. NPDC005555 TaxID=3154889 RepID=UPI0033AFB7B9